MTAKNTNELESMLRKQLRVAMGVAAKKAMDEMNKEVAYPTGRFYRGGTPVKGGYHRTGALGDTPRTTKPKIEGDTASFEAYLDKSHKYTTGDQPTMIKVLRLANDEEPWETRWGSLARSTVGESGFWDRAEDKIKESFEKTIQHYFK